MKAVIWTEYGPPETLQLAEVDKPVPKDNEVLIKVCAATVTQADCELRRMKFTTGSWLGLAFRAYVGFTGPARIKILGQEVAGVIESVGKEVTRFKPGDQVFAPCMLHLGAYAEYVCLPETNPILKPANMTYDEAATIPVGGINGLHFLRISSVSSGEKILLNGAGGSIGTYAVQIAKSLGAEVAAVDSAEKLAMLSSIGADRVMDYRQQDFTRNGDRYDVIIDIIGKSPFSRTVRSLKPNGRYVLGNPGLAGMVRGRWSPMASGKRVISEVATFKPEYYATLRELIQAGKIRSIIDRRYPLEQIAEAHRYVEQGHKKGNVVITLDHDTKSA